MKGSTLDISLLLLFLLASCSPAGKHGDVANALEATDSCKSDPGHRYEVYIPERNSLSIKLPLLVIIDAHGDGRTALAKFKHGADQYPVVLIASDLIKNGYTDYEGAIKALIDDVRQKYPVNESIFMTGFSGGARMVLGYALAHQINGMVLCGALANADQIRAIRCPIISISGMDDFNFIETAQYLFQEPSIPGTLKIELTGGSHNWPDSLILGNALGFLYFSCQVPDPGSYTKRELQTYVKHQHEWIDSLAKAGKLLEAVIIARNMSVTAPFNSDKTFATAYKQLKTDPVYNNQIGQLQNCLNLEIKARQPYLEAFMTKDSMWWINEVSTIDKKIDSETDPFMNDMYQRIRGFLGIACYSLGNQAIKERNAEKLEKIVFIYHELEPENPYVLYFSAFPYFWEGNVETTLSMLRKAREMGFSDMAQLTSDFPVSITSKLQ